MTAMTPSSLSPVMTRDTAIALGNAILEMLPENTWMVTIDQIVRAVTTVANGAVLSNDDGTTLILRFNGQFRNGMPVTIGTNVLDDSTLRRVVTNALALAPSHPGRERPLDPDDEVYFGDNQKEYLPVSLWHERTIAAMGIARETAIPGLVDQVREARLMASATIGFAARASCYVSRLGLSAYSRETDCEVTVTARTTDGTASGWGGAASRDWADINLQTIASHATEIANKSRHCSAFEPGRYVTILSAAAVAQLVRQMAPVFDANFADQGLGAFGIPDRDIQQHFVKHNKIGMQVFDPRVVMISDPADPEGGFPPFFEVGGNGFAGHPIPAVTWVDHGILRNLAYASGYALFCGKTACEQPFSVRVTTVPGTPTATIDEMIANCERGIYVNRLSDVRLVDAKTGMMTGVTRDGCFFVKNGKIDRPIKNLRFTDSPFFAFNKLEMVGIPVRAAFGYNARPVLRDSHRWPRLPVIVPPMMIQDFNFTALVDAV